MFTVVSPSSGDALVARQRDRLEEHLRQHDRGSAVQIDAAREPRDTGREVAEVAKARVADRRAGRIRVHVDDVGADRHVHGDRDAETVGRRHEAAIGPARRSRSARYAPTA